MAPKNYTPIHHVIAKHARPDKSPQPAAPATVIPASSKESEPLAPAREPLQIQEVVEHEVTDKDVKPYVETHKEVPRIPVDLRKLGIQTNVTPKFPSYQNVTLPLDHEKIPVGLQQPVNTSYRWLAELARYLLEQSQAAHHTIKKGFKELVFREFKRR